MRLHRSQRLRRLIRYFPRRRPLNWLEAFLCLLLGFQLARLVWAAVTPSASFGAWTPSTPTTLPPAARATLLASFDPFFRASIDEGARQTATGLPLRLFGIRSNLASGGGSAIIATPDGLQTSYAVGDKIVDGVILKQVADDHVTLDRAGASEVLYLDQSVPAPVVGSAALGTPLPATAAEPLAIPPPPIETNTSGAR